MVTMQPLSSFGTRGRKAAVVLGLAFTAATSASGQLPTSVQPAAPAVAQDPYGRDTPRGLVSGLVATLGGAEPERTAAYLDLDELPPARRANAAADYARRLGLLLDQGGRLARPTDASAAPQGDLKDGLAIDEERIGSLFETASARNTPIIAVRSDIGGRPLWRISPATLASIPAVVASASWRRSVPGFLADRTLLGAPPIDWLILFGIGLVLFASVRLIFAFALLVLGRFKRDREVGQIWRLGEAASSPLSLFITVALFLSATASAGVSIVARTIVGQFVGGVLALALLWLLWRLADVGALILIERLHRAERRRLKSTILFGQKAIKLLLGALGVAAILATIGVNVTAGLAALGIGGIALALGAQKTIENVVGSVSIVADGVLRVGDCCRIGEVTAVVEEIGIRSTRLRTSEGTRVSLPNGALSAMQIENFATRDRFSVSETFQLANGLSADAVQRRLRAMREIVAAAEFVADGMRVNLVAIAASGPVIELVGHLATSDPAVAAVSRERLLLVAMRTLYAPADAGRTSDRLEGTTMAQEAEE